MSINSANYRALVFDLMGTCCDWHSSILQVLESLPSPKQLPKSDLSNLASTWRAGFFQAIQKRFQGELPPEDIDITHRRVLDNLLRDKGVDLSEWDNSVRERLVEAWHEQQPWPDVIPALSRLKKKFFVVVLANGTTRLQLDIVRSSSLPFHMLFSSQLLGMTKPDPAIYRKAAELMGVEPEECVMVAAHAYDSRAAQGVGMTTVYVRRSTEDLAEDFHSIENEVNLYFDGRDGSKNCGLGALADAFEGMKV